MNGSGQPAAGFRGSFPRISAVEELPFLCGPHCQERPARRHRKAAEDEAATARGEEGSNG
jgi:hypothetical protein